MIGRFFSISFAGKRRKGVIGATCILLVVAFLMNHEGGSGAYLRRLSARNISPPSTIGIVHLGQCHGQDLEAMLKIHRNNEGNALAKHLHKMYYHFPRSLETAGENHQSTPQSVWIALIRDPIDRIIAVWNFEHPTNRPFRKYPTKVSEEMRAKKNALYKCYNTIDELATVGLSDAFETASFGNEGADTTSSCALLVRELLENQKPFPDMTDFKLNYGHYYQSLLSPNKEKKKKMFVIRSEHMVHDLNKINILMGGRSNVFDVAGAAPPVIESQYWAQGADISNNPLAVSSTFVSKEGMHNLCRILCHEIQLYQQLVHQAANVHSEELAEMTVSLRTKCGADIANMLTPFQQQQQQRQHFFMAARKGWLLLKHPHKKNKKNNNKQKQDYDYTCPSNPWTTETTALTE